MCAARGSVFVWGGGGLTDCYVTKFIEIIMQRGPAYNQLSIYPIHLFCMSLQKMKLYLYVNPNQMKDLRPALEFARKSIAIREILPGEEHRVRYRTIMGSWSHSPFVTKSAPIRAEHAAQMESALVVCCCLSLLACIIQLWIFTPWQGGKLLNKICIFSLLFENLNYTSFYYFFPFLFLSFFKKIDV